MSAWTVTKVERGRFKGWWRIEGPPLVETDRYARTVGYIVRRQDAEAIVAAMRATEGQPSAEQRLWKAATA